MAAGARRSAGADIGVGITGIAGPDGGKRREAGGPRLHRPRRSRRNARAPGAVPRRSGSGPLPGVPGRARDAAPGPLGACGLVSLQAPREASLRTFVALAIAETDLCAARRARGVAPIGGPWPALDAPRRAPPDPAVPRAVNPGGSGIAREVLAARGGQARPSSGAGCRGLGLFPERGKARVLWLGIGCLARSWTCRRRARRRRVAAGFAPEPRPFVPHLTLGRWRERARRPELRPGGSRRRCGSTAWSSSGATSRRGRGLHSPPGPRSWRRLIPRPLGSRVLAVTDPASALMP